MRWPAALIDLFLVGLSIMLVLVLLGLVLDIKTKEINEKLDIIIEQTQPIASNQPKHITTDDIIFEGR